jgi:FlaG/FlaF family flagellin (archaellin)
MWPGTDGRDPVDRGVGPVVGVVLMIVVTALLAGIVGASVVTTPVEQDAPQAMVGLSVDTADDQVEVEHVGGDRLDSDRIKIRP